ncbi:MAG: hypothetical protein MMC33_005448 [Icmadophila ericetorum]|nr:hypothetical protein [Icmadophila ericetorum]
MFSAQDNQWETEWRPRTEIPLNFFKAKWLNLKTIPVDVAADLRADTGGQFVNVAGLTGGKSTDYFSRALSESMRHSGYRKGIECKAQWYLQSNPGNDSFGENGRVINPEELDTLSHVLSYRMNCMELAALYKEYLALEFADCIYYDPDIYIAQSSLAARESAETGDSVSTKRGRIEGIRQLFTKQEVFNKVVPRQGFAYSKFRFYLAIVLAESELNRSEVEAAVERLIPLCVNHKVNTILQKQQQLTHGSYSKRHQGRGTSRRSREEPCNPPHEE